MKSGKIKLLFTLFAVTVLLLIGTAVAFAQDEEPREPANDYTCTEFYGWTTIDIPGDSHTYTLNLDTLGVAADQGIINVCYKASTDEYFDGPFGLDPLLRTYSFTSANGHGLSHIGYKLGTGEPEKEAAVVEYTIDCDCVDEVISQHTITFTTITGATVYLYEDDTKATLLGTYTTSGSKHEVKEGYYFEWEADLDHTGSGSETIGTLDQCCIPLEQPSAVIEDPWCEWTGTKSQYIAEWELVGAGFSIAGTGSTVYSYGPVFTNGSTTLELGTYDWSWENTPGFSADSGGGSWDLTAGCEPGKAAASISSYCSYVDGASIHTVNLTVFNATFYINNKDYIEDATLKLSPGDYPWNWVGEDQSEDNGLLTLGTCAPKEKEPDVAAGGLGPSFIATVAPAVLTVSGLALTWVLIKKRIKKTN
jgi:hypothetical protein